RRPVYSCQLNGVYQSDLVDSRGDQSDRVDYRKSFSVSMRKQDNFHGGSYPLQRVDSSASTESISKVHQNHVGLVKSTTLIQSFLGSRI
ncbi:hypothetical protein CHS0354_031141, partial [Potamilus streckersoni]